MPHVGEGVFTSASVKSRSSLLRGSGEEGAESLTDSSKALTPISSCKRALNMVLSMAGDGFTPDEASWVSMEASESVEAVIDRGMAVEAFERDFVNRGRLLDLPMLGPSSSASSSRCVMNFCSRCAMCFSRSRARTSSRARRSSDLDLIISSRLVFSSSRATIAATPLPPSKVTDLGRPRPFSGSEAVQAAALADLCMPGPCVEQSAVSALAAVLAASCRSYSCQSMSSMGATDSPAVGLAAFAASAFVTRPTNSRQQAMS
mmetsp:Transcript_53110/g.137179  ORF Transcript_53110/g.137179 Transcript_53110/m.137179 type:complete len:261 (+) Transcript_53110:664-1446(+)